MKEKTKIGLKIEALPLAVSITLLVLSLVAPTVVLAILILPLSILGYFEAMNKLRVYMARKLIRSLADKDPHKFKILEKELRKGYKV